MTLEEVSRLKYFMHYRQQNSVKKQAHKFHAAVTQTKSVIKIDIS